MSQKRFVVGDEIIGAHRFVVARSVTGKEPGSHLVAQAIVTVDHLRKPLRLVVCEGVHRVDEDRLDPRRTHDGCTVVEDRV